MDLKIKVALYFLLSFFMLFSTTFYPDNNQNDLYYEPYQLGEIVVTGSKPVAEKVETIFKGKRYNYENIYRI